MSRLKLFLLGPPRLEREGERLEINTRKSMALMAFLAVSGQTHRREALTTLLWPNSRSRSARAILRTTLSGLNKILAGEGLLVERDRIGLDREADIWLDVEQFQQLAQSWQTHGHPQSEPCNDCLLQLAEAVALYRGDFLEGFTLPDSADFDDWQAFETNRLRRELAGVLEKLVVGHRTQGHFDTAITYAQRWLALDPLHEPAHRCLMQLYAESGHRSAALRQYQTCYELLEDELGVHPETETTALYERIQQETAQYVKIITGSYGLIEGDTPEGLARSLLGQGGMGNVYRGIDTQTGEPVAIKALKPEIVASNPDLVERFVREGEALRQLNHPNIVKLLAAAEQDNQHYLVMEFVDGGSLRDLIKQEKPLSISRILELALDLADALTRAHRLNIIHRDLKPANVLLAQDGTPRLTDFGIARLTDSSQITETGLLVGTINYLSPEGCDGHRLDERADIWAFGAVLFEMLSGKRPFKGETMSAILAAIVTQPTPDLNQYRDDIPQPLADLVYRMLLKDREQRIPSVRLVGAELEAILAERPMTPTTPLPVPAGPPPPCPYRGLFAFQEEDAAFFFGRETFTETLVEAVQNRGLVAVIGPSGSGKSSVVQAGLVARLRQQEEGWLIDEFRPGSDPFGGLAATLLPLLEPDLSVTDQLVELRKLDESLENRELPLADIIDRILLQHPEASRLLLVVDQFEELYTLCPDPETRYSFLDLLFEIIDLQQYQTQPIFTLVFTLRADFLEQALAHRPFADIIQGNDFKLGPMQREELGLAVERPAEKQGLTFESGLVERILDDVGEEPGNLPLLEFALTTLWEQQQARTLTHTGYETIARVEGALTRHADFVYAGLSPTEQETARHLFTQLVRPGEATEDTRRLALRTELKEAAWRLVQRLADARLVVTGRDAAGNETVEVVHEALIRSWDQLRRWMEADRSFRAWQERLRAALYQWGATDQDEGALLRGLPLAEAENWLRQREVDLSRSEQAYIEASLAARQEREAAEEAQLQRELETAQKLAKTEKQRAEEQTQAAGRLRWLAVGLAVFLLAAVAAAWFALNQQDIAQRNAAEAQNVALIAGSQAALVNDDTDTALALARQAVSLNPDSAAAQAQLSEVAYTPGTVRRFLGHTDVVFALDISPDGRTILSGSDDKTLILWDIETGEMLKQLEGHTTWLNDAVFSPDGQLAASVSDEMAILWDVPTGRMIRQFDGHKENISRVAFSPDGQSMVTSGRGDDSILIHWDVVSGEIIQQFESNSRVQGLEFTPDGSALLSTSSDGLIVLWAVETGEIIYELNLNNENLGVPLGSVRTPAISPDGLTAVIATEDFGIFLWDLSTGTLLQRHEISGGTGAVTFHPHNGTVLVGGVRGTLMTLDLQTGDILDTLRGHNNPVNKVVITPNGRYAVTASGDKTLRLWELERGQVIRRFAAPDAFLREVDLGPDGRTALSASTDGSVTLWDVERGEMIRRFTDDQPATAVTYSPDGQTALIGTGYRFAEKVEPGHIILWDMETGEEIRRFEGHPYAVFDVEFSPDGKWAVSSGNGPVVILWDAETGQEIRRFEDYFVDSPWPVESFWDIKFSPDGSTILAGFVKGPIILWDVETGEEIGQLVGHDGAINGITVSADGQRVVSSGWDHQAILWDMQTNSIIRRFTNHAGPIGQVDFTPDERLMLGGSGDGTNSLWDVETGEQVRRYANGFVIKPVFNADGSQALVGFQDGAVELWRIDTTLEQLLEWTQANRYMPDLTCEQRELYRIEPLCQPVE